MIVASRTASFGLPEVTRGIIPGGGGTQLLARLIGPARAKHIALTGRQLTGQEAFDMGIVQILTDEGEALNKGIELAKQISVNASVAAKAMKQSIDEAKLLELKYYDTLIGTCRTSWNEDSSIPWTDSLAPLESEFSYKIFKKNDIIR